MLQRQSDEHQPTDSLECAKYRYAESLKSGGGRRPVQQKFVKFPIVVHARNPVSIGVLLAVAIPVVPHRDGVLSAMGIFHQSSQPLYENVSMDEMPQLHDGFFDGLWLSGDKSVLLFVRTEAGERSTIALSGVEAMEVSDVKVGNIIFDLALTPTQNLTAPDIQQLYGLRDDGKEAAELLRRAQQKGLSLLTINPSYGAHGLVLFETAKILPNHILPITTG